MDFEKNQLKKSLSNKVCSGCFFDKLFRLLKRFHQKIIKFFLFLSNYIHTISQKNNSTKRQSEKRTTIFSLVKIKIQLENFNTK